MVFARVRWLLPLVALLVGVPVATTAAATACGPRLLILSAMPLEIDPLVKVAALDPARTTRIDGRMFFAGQLAGHEVVLALTGIGMANAKETATLAFEHARCPFTATVFSGVAGSSHPIGDVAIPSRWSSDGGTTWTGVDRRMYAVAATLAGATKVPLEHAVPTGDAACACPGVSGPPLPVDLKRTPSVDVGGSGTTSDNDAGHAVPCVPGGGDIEGCEPCITIRPLDDTETFADRVPSLADPTFFLQQLQPPAPTSSVDAVDQETAVVAEVARDHRVPFLGIRAVSDGPGDPLGLPGFPAQFAVYRQLAGDNAAAVTMAFLRAWKG